MFLKINVNMNDFGTFLISIKQNSYNIHESLSDWSVIEYDIQKKKNRTEMLFRI